MVQPNLKSFRRTCRIQMHNMREAEGIGNNFIVLWPLRGHYTAGIRPARHKDRSPWGQNIFDSDFKIFSKSGTNQILVHSPVHFLGSLPKIIFNFSGMINGLIHSFTKLLKLRNYEFECCYLQRIDKQAQFHENIL